MRLSVNNALLMQKEKQEENKEKSDEVISYRQTSWCDYWEVRTPEGKIIRKERFEPFH